MKTRCLLAVPALLVGALVAQAGIAPPAHAATLRYASSTGSGTACTSVAPCDLVTAVNGAGSNAEVVVATGTYNLGTTGLASSQSGMSVHGVFGQPRPVINTSAVTGLGLTGTGSKVADLTLNHSGQSFALNVFASGIVVERVEVRSSAPVTCGVGYSGLARDLLCINTAPGGIALDDSWGGGTGTLIVRNLTAIASGAGSYGIRADATDSNTNLDINARNVIASGSTADVRATQTGSRSDSDVSMAYSNYDTIEEGNGGNVTNVGSTSSNQIAPPIFADALSYHQVVSSPTVDKGSSDFYVGTADLDGEPRKYGAAVDIGADEWLPDTTAPDVAFDRTPGHKTRKRKAVFKFHASEAVSYTCKVDKKRAKPCGSPLKVKVKRYGKHTLVVMSVDTSGNIDATPATYTWKYKRKSKRGHHKPHHAHHHH